MQDKRLFINGLEVHLSDRTKIGLTKQANNIGELQNRQGDFTNTFRIPLNGHNKTVLEFANVMTSTTLLPYKKLSITYEEGGIEILSRAEGIIKNSDESWIYIDCVGGNIDLVRSIGEITVGELFQDEDSHIWNFANVVNSRSGSDYWIYAFIDWRTDKTTFFDSPTVDPAEMLPTCKATSFLNKIELYTDYTFTGSYLNSDDHTNMIITPDEFTQNPANASNVNLVASSAYLPNGEVEVLEGGGYISPTNAAVEMTVNGTNFFNGSYYPPTNEVGKLRWTGVFTSRRVYINGGLGLFETPQNKEHWFAFQIKEDGLVLAELTIPHYSGEIFDLDSFQDYVIDIETPEIVLSTGSQYYLNIVVYAERHTNADTQVEFGFSGNESTFTKSPVDRLVYGNEIRFIDLFRMKAVDVLKDILNLRGLIIQTNSYTREVSINYFSDLITNKGIAEDWSALVDVRQTQLFYKFGNYAQKNNFLFQENEGVQAGLGDYYFNISDTTLEAESTAVQLNHSATQSKPKYFGKVIPEIEAIETDLNEWKSPGWRILQLEKQPTNYSVTYDDGTTSQIVTTNVPFCRFVGFEELIPENYGALVDILTSTKALVLLVKLDPIKIQNLDFVVPKKLEIPELDISGFFYVNKISNYQGGLTSVEFVRL